MTLDRFLAQDLTLRDHHTMVPVIRLWDELFSISYFKFREELNLLARTNWQDIPGNMEIIEGLDQFCRLVDSGQDAVIIPVDDDDWFSPRLDKVIPKITKSTAWIAWNDGLFSTGFQDQHPVDSTRLKFDRDRLFKVRHNLRENSPEAVSKTNSIAFRLSALPADLARETVLENMRYHARVGPMLSKPGTGGLPVNFTPVTGHYSLINRNMASITQIVPNIEVILNYPSLFLEHARTLANLELDTLPASFSWAERPIGHMKKLYRELVS